jgi:hypothetical protein
MSGCLNWVKNSYRVSEIIVYTGSPSVNCDTCSYKPGRSNDLSQQMGNGRGHTRRYCIYSVMHECETSGLYGFTEDWILSKNDPNGACFSPLFPNMRLRDETHSTGLLPVMSHGSVTFNHNQNMHSSYAISRQSQLTVFWDSLGALTLGTSIYR